MRLLLAILLPAAVAAAESPTVDKAAADALAAVTADESAALRLLAERNEPDPWLVVAELCARKKFEAAEAFARAAPRADLAKLPAQIDAWKKSPPAWSELAAACAALDRGETATARTALESLDAAGESLFSARLLAARARASGRADGFERAAVVAQSIGWLRLAADCRKEQAQLLEREDLIDAALVAANARLAIETGRGVRANLPAALTEAGRLSLQAKRLPEAEDLLRRALRQAQREKDAIAIARSERFLGNVLIERGATQDARVYLLRARKALEGRGEELLDVLALLIELDRRIDGIDTGLRRAGEMLELARKAKRPDSEGLALAAMADMQMERKDYVAANRRFTQAEDAFRRANRTRQAARVGYERGSLALRTGRLAEAHSALAGALELVGEDGPKPLRARIHAALGEWAVESGQEEAAQEHLDAAAALAVEIQDSALAARTLARRGRLALRRREWDEARTVLEKALAEERKANAPADVARTLLDLAEIDIEQDKSESARTRTEEAMMLARKEQEAASLARAVALDARTRLGEEDADRIVDRVRAGARESLKLLEAQRAPSTARFEACLTELLNVGTDAAIAANDAGTLLAAGEYGRARLTLHSLGGREALMRVLTPAAMAKRLEETRARESKAIAEYQRQRERMARDQMLRARERVKALQQEREALEEERLAALSGARWLLSPGVPTLEALQAAIAPNETLLYYCVGTQTAAVLMVTGGGASIRPVGDRATVEEDVQALMRGLAGEAPYPAIQRFQVSQMDKLALAEGRELIIAAPAPLDRVPFAAVTPKQTVRYVSSAADLIRQAAEASKPATGILGVGNPEFGTGEQRLRLVHLRNGIPLRRLEIATTLAQQLGDSVLVGTSATESQFRTALRARERWRAIHFAVPGLLDSHRPYLGSLALAPDDDEDGLLTTYDLMRLRLPAGLAVLAACEPAKGTRNVMPAIRGMTQSLHLAGSARVLISQWYVEDKAASTLMTKFYSYYANGRTAAPLALRRAQYFVSSLPGWAHPKAWAGWQLWGAR